MECSDYNKPGQETMLYQHQNLQYLHRISVHIGDTNAQFRLLLPQTVTTLYTVLFVFYNSPAVFISYTSSFIVILSVLV